EVADAEMVQQPQHVVGVGVPRPVDLDRPRRLAAIGVAQVEGDAAVLVLELGGGVEWRGGRVLRVGNRRVQPAAGNDQQRKTGADVFVINPHIAFFIERHGISLLSERHSRTSGNPGLQGSKRLPWTPAFAGVTSGVWRIPPRNSGATGPPPPAAAPPRPDGWS